MVITGNFSHIASLGSASCLPIPFCTSAKREFRDLQRYVVRQAPLYQEVLAHYGEELHSLETISDTDVSGEAARPKCRIRLALP